MHSEFVVSFMEYQYVRIIVLYLRNIKYRSLAKLHKYAVLLVSFVNIYHVYGSL